MTKKDHSDQNRPATSQHKPIQPSASDSARLFSDIRALIESTRTSVAQAVNSALVILYWSIGDRIRRDILKGNRAGYGEQIEQTLSAQLREEHGEGYGRRNLFNMLRFAEMCRMERWRRAFFVPVRLFPLIHRGPPRRLPIHPDISA